MFDLSIVIDPLAVSCGLWPRHTDQHPCPNADYGRGYVCALVNHDLITKEEHDRLCAEIERALREGLIK